MDLQSLPWYAQFLVFLLVGGIIFGIFYMLYYSDGQNKIRNLDRQIDKLEIEIKKAEKKEAQLSQIKEEKEAKEKVLEKLKEILPEEKEIAQILRKVQGILTTARLKIQKWAGQKERPREVYVEHPIAITLDGNYHNLGQFFDQLSKLKKIFTVNSLRITPMSKMTSQLTIKASFTAATYTYREKVRKKKPAKRRRGRRAPKADEGLEGVI
ncbi:MAG: type 4a pilus biogenesis protein PilO [Candidatus Aminicenantes bacterium]|nr:MAG: type 4a pilus biogenesis protein PilO [Candidatus Aminicenantes bacterium]